MRCGRIWPSSGLWLRKGELLQRKLTISPVSALAISCFDDLS